VFGKGEKENMSMVRVMSSERVVSLGFSSVKLSTFIITQ